MLVVVVVIATVIMEVKYRVLRLMEVVKVLTEVTMEIWVYCQEGVTVILETKVQWQIKKN